MFQETLRGGSQPDATRELRSCLLHLALVREPGPLAGPERAAGELAGISTASVAPFLRIVMAGMGGRRGMGCAAGKEEQVPPSLLLSRISEEESGSHFCQLGSHSHFPKLGLAPQASCLLFVLQALLQEPLAFCLHRCIIPRVT